MPIDIQALPLDSINTKWKEPYASASLNKRFVGITPQGIYRGLILTPDPLSGDRTVIISQDADNSDHVAVFQNENDFQVGYRDTVSGDITLTLTAYSGVDVLVTLFIDYQIGFSTSGTYRVYTQAEFDGLGASFKKTLIVLGTVTVPVSGAITASSISLNSRTLASANIQPGTIPSTLITRNPNFEIGEVNQSYELSSQFWEKSVSVGAGTWRTSSDRADSGVKSIELAVSVAPFTGVIKQQAGIEVTAGQLLTTTISVWQDKVISSGTFVYFMEFSDSTGTLLSTSSQTLDAGVDTGFREVTLIINVPAGASTIRSFGVQCIALDPSSVGIFAYIDSLRVLVEPRAADEAHVFDQRFRQRESVSGLRIADASGNFADPSADLSFDKDTPAGEGRVSLLPTNPSDDPPAFKVAGRIVDLGSQLLGAAANALKARITAEQATAGVSTYTLMWESKRTGVGGSRTYVKEDGTLVNTGNARWAGANWVKDVNAVEASMTEFGTDGASSFFIQGSGVDSWADGSWTTEAFSMSSTGGATFAGGVKIGSAVDNPAAGEILVSGAAKFGDAGFYAELLSAGNESTIAFHTSVDALVFTRDTNTFTFKIGGTSEAAVNANGISANSFIATGTQGNTPAVSRRERAINNSITLLVDVSTIGVALGDSWNVSAITSFGGGFFNVDPLEVLSSNGFIMCSLGGLLGATGFCSGGWNDGAGQVVVWTTNSSATLATRAVSVVGFN